MRKLKRPYLAAIFSFALGATGMYFFQSQSYRTANLYQKCPFQNLQELVDKLGTGWDINSRGGGHEGPHSYPVVIASLIEPCGFSQEVWLYYMQHDGRFSVSELKAFYAKLDQDGKAETRRYIEELGIFRTGRVLPTTSE